MIIIQIEIKYFMFLAPVTFASTYLCEILRASKYSVDEYERRCRIKDLVSQNLGMAASDSEVEVAMIECYEFHKDPVQKAERAANRKIVRSRDPRVATLTRS